MKYTFSTELAQQQYVGIKVELITPNDETFICLPTWRPGRYELANFAKNVRYFKVLINGKEVNAPKVELHKWKVDTTGVSEITVTYQYYAAELNAGSTFLDNNQLYVNPVNCCIYLEGEEDQPCEVVLNVPAEFDFAGSLEKKGEVYLADSFHELVDSPFICSNMLQHDQYESNGTLFHVWFNGEAKPDWTKLKTDFQKFTDYQIARFQEFPVNEYHFLIHALPYKAYHGVEHVKSTVISLGPSYDIFENLYTELLGVSSHELYHTWNVKSIRPIEMYPYNYSKENLSPLGYLCEGVTTYMGDIILLRSGVFDLKQYFVEMTKQLQRHFDNFGRYNYSVAESSVDTWLDGYQAGAPGRKVSIYTEGCLLAFVTEISIMKATVNLKGLNHVMRSLYWDYADKKIGVSEADYKAAIENVTGKSMDWLFDDYIHGTRGFEVILANAFEYLGIELNTTPSPIYSHGRLGYKCISSGDSSQVKAIFPGSPADLGGLMLDDIVVAVNGCVVNNDMDKWLTYFNDELKHLTVHRKGKQIELTLPEVNRNFYQIYSLSLIEKPDKHQEFALRAWTTI